MLPRRERITKGSEIKEILKRRRVHFSSPLLYFVAEENHGISSRLAVVCSSQLGGAVSRNRAKRAVVGAFSKIRHRIAKKIDLVIVPRTLGGDLAACVLSGLRRAKLI